MTITGLNPEVKVLKLSNKRGDINSPFFIFPKTLPVSINPPNIYERSKSIYNIRET